MTGAGVGSVSTSSNAGSTLLQRFLREISTGPCQLRPIAGCRQTDSYQPGRHWPSWPNQYVDEDWWHMSGHSSIRKQKSLPLSRSPINKRILVRTSQGKQPQSLYFSLVLGRWLMHVWAILRVRGFLYSSIREKNVCLKPLSNQRRAYISSLKYICKIHV